MKKLLSLMGITFLTMSGVSTTTATSIIPKKIKSFTNEKDNIDLFTNNFMSLKNYSSQSELAVSNFTNQQGEKLDWNLIKKETHNFINDISNIKQSYKNFTNDELVIEELPKEVINFIEDKTTQYIETMEIYDLDSSWSYVYLFSEETKFHDGFLDEYVKFEKLQKENVELSTNSKIGNFGLKRDGEDNTYIPEKERIRIREERLQWERDLKEQKEKRDREEEERKFRETERGKLYEHRQKHLQWEKKLRIARTTLITISVASAVAAAGFYAAAVFFGLSIPWAVASTAISVATGAAAGGISVALTNYEVGLKHRYGFPDERSEWEILKDMAKVLNMLKQSANVIKAIYTSILKPIFTAVTVVITASSWAFPPSAVISAIIGSLISAAFIIIDEVNRGIL